MKVEYLMKMKGGNAFASVNSIAFRFIIAIGVCINQ